MPASLEAIDQTDAQRFTDVMTSNADDLYSGHHLRAKNLPSISRTARIGPKAEAPLERRLDALAIRRLFTLPRDVIGLGYLGSYVLLDWASFVQPISPIGITPWNPGAGLGLAVVILFGRRLIPYLFLAPLLADLVNLPTLPPWSVELLVSALIGGGYAAASMFLLRPAVQFDPALPSLRDLVLLMLVGLVSASFVAAGSVGLVTTFGLLPTHDMAAATLRYWVGDLIGIMVITPFVLILLTHRHAIRVSVEFVIQVAAICTALTLIFGIAEERQFQLFYALFLPIVWMAIRGGLEGASVGIFITQIGLIAGIELSGDGTYDFMAIQLLMLILAMTGLVAGQLVTERRNTEFELRLHRDSLARIARRGSLGELAAAIAHEINQPLTTAGTYTRLVTDALHAGDSDHVMVAQTAEKAAAQVERAAEVVRRLRALVRLDRSGRAPCSVEEIITETVALCQPALDRGRCVVRWSITTDIPSVMVDMLQIEQTLLNIIRNSIEAIEESCHGKGLINIEAAPRGGGEIEIWVADNGPGFPSDFTDRFLPFGSRKKEGLGIGLSLCRSIVEAHGGRLWLNRNARGAEVHFTLPAAEETGHE